MTTQAENYSNQKAIITEKSRIENLNIGELTGGIRFRVQHRLFDTDLVVLQVEYRCNRFVHDSTTMWRDACITDVTTGAL